MLINLPKSLYTKEKYSNYTYFDISSKLLKRSKTLLIFLIIYFFVYFGRRTYLLQKKLTKFLKQLKIIIICL